MGFIRIMGINYRSLNGEFKGHHYQFIESIPLKALDVLEKWECIERIESCIETNLWDETIEEKKIALKWFDGYYQCVREYFSNGEKEKNLLTNVEFIIHWIEKRLLGLRLEKSPTKQEKLHVKRGKYSSLEMALISVYNGVLVSKKNHSNALINDVSKVNTKNKRIGGLMTDTKMRNQVRRIKKILPELNSEGKNVAEAEIIILLGKLQNGEE